MRRRRKGERRSRCCLHFAFMQLMVYTYYIRCVNKEGGRRNRAGEPVPVTGPPAVRRTRHRVLRPFLLSQYFFFFFESDPSLRKAFFLINFHSKKCRSKCDRIFLKTSVQSFLIFCQKKIFFAIDP